MKEEVCVERMELLTEISRALYHLDLFRRNFRSISHACTGIVPNCSEKDPCVVSAFKDLFESLSKMMREPILDPPSIGSLIHTKLSSLPLQYNHRIYEQLMETLHVKSTGMSTPNCDTCPIHLLSTEFSLTKVCLTCRTTCHVERICQYAHLIETPWTMFKDYPSFEFGLKTALDANEFCVKPNCFGNLKIFRCLREPPSLLTFKFADFRLNCLPKKILPCLIFESSSSCELNISSVVVVKEGKYYGCLFFHSRLNLWIFFDTKQVMFTHKDFDVAKLHESLDGYVPLFAFYTKSDQRLNEERIYENWPLDTDSGQGSEELSSSEYSQKESVNHAERFATIRKGSKGKGSLGNSISVPDLRFMTKDPLSLNKKVSFNCEVTLVDEDEEYIPHPIFQSVMERMKL